MSVFDTSGNETESPIKLFISHASEDRDLAAALVELLVFALKLPAATVRCTSVDGYGLPGGARTDEVLRAEVHDAPAFVGIVSQNSARSVYVLFELGARWGAGRHLLPILAPGTHVSVLGGPLANLNALKADNRAQLSRLVTEIARRLGIVPDDPAAYQTHINRIIAIKQTDSWPKQEVAQEAPSTPQLAPRNAAISAYGASPADDGISDLELDMADLFGPLRSALAQHKFIREFFALPNRAVMIGGSSIPRLRFNADQIPDLMTKLGILEERGLVRDVSKYANAPIYRMSDRLVRLLIGS